MSDTAATEVDALLAHGIAGLDAGQLPAAIGQLRRAIERDAGNGELFFRLGECYARGDEFGPAIHAFERAIELAPDHFAAYRLAAAAAVAQSQKALAAGNSKAARDLKKFAAMYLLALGKRQHRQFLDAAEATFLEATTLDPKCAEAFWALGDFLETRGRSSEAEKPLRRAIALDPNMPHAYVTLGNTFQSRWRYEEMEAAYRKALALKPDLQEVRQSLGTIPLVNMLYDDKATAETIYARHRAWGEEFAAGFRATGASARPFANSRDPERRLRIAYFSADFRYHAVSFFFQPLFAHHDPAAVEVFCYADVEKPDPVTKFLQGLGGIWRDVSKLSDEALRAQFRTDEIDIAIDLAGLTNARGLRALAMKPAPVTATWLGYPATTGLACVDWRITDAIVDPPGQEAFHAERLMRLPDVFLCYNAYMTPLPEVAPVPALAKGSITFGSFNSPQKMSPPTISAWARILDAVPGSRLVLKSPAYAEPTKRQYFLDRFAANGIGADRIELWPPQPEMAAHLASYSKIDIALDPFPYNGTTTTCEALWMGVPMVSLIGDRHAGRVGFDLLSQVGLAELAASDIGSYVATAVGLAGDLPRLEQLRSVLRDRMRASPLCDAPRFARAFERALRAMWQEWCQR
jgi:predicted O-linked N-acetylglucosamine transferase (SPINDLY family)